MNGLEPQQFDCVIWGGYARGNTGDEWCLAATLERLRPRFGRSMAVLSFPSGMHQMAFSRSDGGALCRASSATVETLAAISAWLRIGSGRIK